MHPFLLFLLICLFLALPFLIKPLFNVVYPAAMSLAVVLFSCWTKCAVPA